MQLKNGIKSKIGKEMAGGKKLFKKGNKAATVNKGKLQKTTIVKARLGLPLSKDTMKKIKDKVEKGECDIEELKPMTTAAWYELLSAKKTRGFAAKELSKYIYPQKREHEIKGEGIKVIINYDTVKDK
jgi:hypothetical protein